MCFSYNIFLFSKTAYSVTCLPGYFPYSYHVMSAGGGGGGGGWGRRGDGGAGGTGERGKVSGEATWQVKGPAIQTSPLVQEEEASSFLLSYHFLRSAFLFAASPCLSFPFL